MLGKEASIHLVFSMIFNQSCNSEIAFIAPGELLKRLNYQSYDLLEMEAKGFNVLFEAISTKPCLHRFPANMAKYIYQSTQIINENYESDPRKIWKDKMDIEIIDRLMTLSGIGKHKATQCLIYLNILGEIDEIASGYIEYMASKCAGFFDNIDNDLQFIRDLQKRLQ